MTTDIVERLRLTSPEDKTASGLMQEAADEIEKLRALVVALQSSLEVGAKEKK